MADTKISQDYSTNPFTWDGTEVLPGIKAGDNGAGLVSGLATFIAGSMVAGPGSAVSGHVATFSGTTGKLIQDSGLTLAGTNTGDQTITLTGDVTGSGTGSFVATLAARSTDSTMAANSATLVPSQSAVVAYVQSWQDGRSWKQVARAATTANGTLATAFANGQVVDGVTLATGDRILVKNQTTGSENGIYTVNASGAPTRTTDADSGAELVNATLEVSEGTANADTQWTQTANAAITVGSTALVWVNISTSTTYTADETTLHLAGNQFSLKAGAVAIDTHAATGKTTPVDADEVPMADSAASFILKNFTWANLKATLKTYFDTLYGSGSGSVTTVSVVTANGVSGTVATASTTPAITLALAAITPSSVSVSTNANSLQTPITSSNNNSGSAAAVRMTLVADVTAISVGVNSSTFTTSSDFGQANEAFIRTPSTAVGLWLHSGGASTIRLGTNGAERMRIDAAGNVGIGGTPTQKFEVIGTATGSQIVARIANSVAAAAGTEAVLSLDTIASGFNVRDAQIRARNNGSNAITLAFYTANAATPVERFQMGPLGQWGIGGANYGNAGDVFTSGGAVAAPSWQAPSGGGSTGLDLVSYSFAGGF